MGHPNEALLRKGYEAFSKGDLDTVRTIFADDIVWHVGGRSPLAGNYKGIDEVFGFFGKTIELSGGTLKLEIHDILANDEHAVALVSSRAERGGKRLADNGAHIFHVKDGKVIEFWAHPQDAYADDEFWS